MNDRLPGTTYSNPIWYGRYRIYLNDCNIDPQCDYVFVHDDYDGADDANDSRSGFGPTVDDCKNQIDEMELT